MRRVARIAGGVVVGLVAVCALVVGVTSALLRTSWGGEQVRRLAVRRINATIAGRLDLRRFHFDGDTVVLEGVALHDPDGELAAQVARVEVRFRLLALLRRHLDVERVELEGPAVFLREDAKGLSLTRALASRRPSPEDGNEGGDEGRGGAFAVDVERLRLTGGLVDFRSTLPGAERHVRLVGLTIQGDASLVEGAARAEADLEARLEAPLRAPLSASLAARKAGGDGRASLSASLGESVLHATADAGGGGVSVNVRRCHVTPAVVRAFAPAVRLLVPLELEGRGSRLGDEIAVSATLEAGAGVVRVDGAWDAARRVARDVVVRGERLDAGALLAELPRSSLSFELRAHGGGRTFDEAEGELVLTIPPGTLSGARVGPAVVRARAAHGQLRLRELHLAAPGVEVTGAGTIAPKHIDVRLALRAADLGLSARSLAPLGGAPWPRVEGRGRVEVGVSGTLAAPTLTVKAQAPTLAVGADRVSGLSLSAHVADVRRPQVGSAELRVEGARLGGRALHDVALGLRSTADTLAVRAATRGPTPVAVTGDGRWGRGRRAFTLEHLEVRTAQLGWTLVAPARLGFEPGHLSLTGLDLRSGRQRIRVDLDERREQLTAAVRLEAIELGALPPLALPPGLVLGGRLDLSADLAGGARAPEGRAQVTLTDGRVGTHRGLTLDLDADVHAGRARGAMSATGLDTSVRSRFDLPARWPLTARAGPVLLELDVAETDLARALAAFDAPAHPALAGRAALSLRLGGTVAAPELTFEVTAKQLVVDGQRVGDAALRVATRRQEAITARVDVGAGPTTTSPFAGTMEAEVGLSLATLMRDRPTTRELLRTPIKARGRLEGIPLAAVARLAGLDGSVRGVASVRVATEGNALAPSGALNVTVTGASGPRFPATDGRLDVAFGERDVRLAAEIVRGQHELLWLSGTVGLPSRRLAEVAALADAPLELRIGLGPLDLHRRRLPGADSSEQLDARGRALLKLQGTPRKPRVDLTADVDDARLGKTALGEAHAEVKYDAGHAAVDVKLSSGSGGALTLRGGSDVDLGYPGVTRGLKVDAIPLDYTLEAQAFDLRWFSGLNDVVAEVGGQLSAKLVAHGTVGAPLVNGQAECRNGLLVLTSLGAYRDLHFKAHGDNEALWLDELEASSGEGHVRLTGNAVAGGASGYDVTASLKMDRFPVTRQGSKLATISLDASSAGRVSAGRSELRAKVLDAHLELSESKQKNLQTLDTPADVVLLRDGKPIGKAEARKLDATTHALAQLARADASAAAASAPPPSTLELTVDAPRNLWIKGKDAALELGLSPDFRVELADEPRLHGQVRVLRGRLDVVGRRFDLQKDSTVRFSGAADNPTLDVTAKYVDEQQNVTATITARGTLEHLNISVSSPDRPDLTEGQLYGLIITGHLQPEGGGLASGSVAGGASPAASLVGGLVAAQLQSVLAKQLPLDVLTIDAGDGLTGSRLEAGTYLTERLYAGYVGRVGANPALLQNRNAVRVEYHLSERWSFDGEYGDVGTGTADLLWTKNY